MRSALFFFNIRCYQGPSAEAEHVGLIPQPHSPPVYTAADCRIPARTLCCANVNELKIAENIYKRQWLYALKY